MYSRDTGRGNSREGGGTPQRSGRWRTRRRRGAGGRLRSAKGRAASSNSDLDIRPDLPFKGIGDVACGGEGEYGRGTRMGNGREGGTWLRGASCGSSVAGMEHPPPAAPPY